MGRTKEENTQTDAVEISQKNAEGKKGTTETGQESKDIVEKEFISFPDIAADVINVLLYQGNEITTAESLLDGPT